MRFARPPVAPVVFPVDCFAPRPSRGHEGSWLQTIRGKSGWLALRRYGSLQSGIDQTWRPGEIELVE
jgi:hypothetical protein